MTEQTAIDQQLLDHADRQTQALDAIVFRFNLLLVMLLLGAVLWSIAVFGG